MKMYYLNYLTYKTVRQVAPVYGHFLNWKQIINNAQSVALCEQRDIHELTFDADARYRH